jgi:hypothetical protein
MNTVVGQTAPESNDNRRGDYRTDQRHPCNRWLASNGKVENADDQQDGDEAKNDSPEKPIRGASVSKHFTKQANDYGNDQPDNKRCESDDHIDTSICRLRM